MKVLVFAPQYLPIVGGIEILIDTLAQQFRKRSVETVVVTDRPGDLPEHEVVNGTLVHRLDFSRAIGAQDSSGLLRALRRVSYIHEIEAANLLHVHAPAQTGAWFIDRLLKKIAIRPPLIVTLHNPLEPDRTPSFVRELLLEADAVTAVAASVLDSAIQFAPRRGFSAVILNGAEEFDIPAPARPQQDEVSPLHRLICVGRLHHDKGFDIAIAALAQLRARGFDADLTIVGGGPARQDLKETAATYGVADQVHFKDMQSHSEAREAIGRSSLVLIPSRMLEGLPLVALEAAHAGIPCVATATGGLPEAVENGVTGLLVPPDDAEALASAVTQLLDDSDLRQKFAQNARRSARKKFDLDGCARRYMMLYGACCAGTLATLRL
jgi:glycogen(starch) synthase